MGKSKLLGFLQLSHRSTIADRMGLGPRCSKTIVDHHYKSGVETTSMEWKSESVTA